MKSIITCTFGLSSNEMNSNDVKRKARKHCQNISKNPKEKSSKKAKLIPVAHKYMTDYFPGLIPDTSGKSGRIKLVIYGPKPPTDAVIQMPSTSICNEQNIINNH